MSHRSGFDDAAEVPMQVPAPFEYERAESVSHAIALVLQPA